MHRSWTKSAKALGLVSFPYYVLEIENFANHFLLIMVEFIFVACLVIKLDLLTSLLDRRDVGNSLCCYISISSYTMKVARMPWLKSWRYLPWCVKPTNYLWLKPGFPAATVVVRGRALLALMETTWTTSACPRLMWHSTL